MIKGLYTAASGMIAATLANDTMASNLANVNTTGFKRDGVNVQGFAEMLLQRTSAQGTEKIGSILTGSKIGGTTTNFAQGGLHTTGNTFDVAIEGDGFFTVQNAQGETMYTRAGNLTVDKDGYLTTMNGDFVQGKLGNITLHLDQGPFTISSQGEIKGKGRTIDTLAIARFENNNTLQKVGDSYFKATSASVELPEPSLGEPAGFQVRQGELETSNSNPITEMVNSIQGMRLYEALQRNIHMHNEALEKAVNDVGKVR